MEIRTPMRSFRQSLVLPIRDFEGGKVVVVWPHSWVNNNKHCEKDEDCFKQVAKDEDERNPKKTWDEQLKLLVNMTS